MGWKRFWMQGGSRSENVTVQLAERLPENGQEMCHRGGINETEKTESQ